MEGESEVRDIKENVLKNQAFNVIKSWWFAVWLVLYRITQISSLVLFIPRLVEKNKFFAYNVQRNITRRETLTRKKMKNSWEFWKFTKLDKSILGLFTQWRQWVVESEMWFRGIGKLSQTCNTPVPYFAVHSLLVNENKIVFDISTRRAKLST